MKHFDGESFDPTLDGKRLTSQFERVKKLMMDHEWHTPPDLQKHCGPGNDSALTARVRDLRKERFGSYTVERRRAVGAKGLFEYRVLPAAPKGQGKLF